MRIWGKLWKDNHLMRDHVAERFDYTMSRTQMVLSSLEEMAHEFDLGVPIWLQKNIDEFQKHSKTRFISDSFVESIDFDFFEFQVIEE